MTAFEKKVTQLANRHGWPIRKLERASIPCYIVTAESYEDFCKLTAALNRCKTLHYQIIYSSSGFRHIVEVFDAVQWNAWQTFERQKRDLVDVFYTVLKANGGDQNAAKAAQHEKAVQIGALEAFNAIYA